MSLHAFYACYYVAVGTSVPYFSPYLKQLGLSGSQVALMLSVAPVLHLGAPLLWGWLADRTRRPDWLLRIACAGALMFVVPLLFVRRMPALLWLYTAHQAFTIAIGGLADSLTLERVRKSGGDYARVRVWGSISFAGVALLLGWALKARGERPGDPLVPAAMILGFFAAFAAACFIHGHGHGAQKAPHASDVRALLRDPRFAFLLLLSPLHWAALAPYHGFFGILVHDRGFGADVLGAAWVVSVVGEIVLLTAFRRIRRHASLITLFAVTFAASALRWWTTAAAHNAAVMVVAQAAHALAFGVFWATSLSWLSECVPPALRATGQMMFTAATYGVGNIVGMTVTGQIYDRTGGATPAYVAAGVLELLPLLLVVTWGRRLVRPPSPPLQT